jgi:hypothetical protein
MKIKEYELRTKNTWQSHPLSPFGGRGALLSPFGGRGACRGASHPFSPFGGRGAPLGVGGLGLPFIKQHSYKNDKKNTINKVKKSAYVMKKITHVMKPVTYVVKPVKDVMNPFMT